MERRMLCGIALRADGAAAFGRDALSNHNVMGDAKDVRNGDP
jgi:hypothetical protein